MYFYLSIVMETLWGCVLLPTPGYMVVNNAITEGLKKITQGNNVWCNYYCILVIVIDPSNGCKIKRYAICGL